MVVDLPPPEYDHEPAQHYTVHVLSPDAVVIACFGIEVACARPKRNWIIVSSELHGEELDRVMRHEKAHLNGWKH